MSDLAPHRRPSALLILLKCRLRQISNLLDQQLRDAPWRSLAVVGLLTLIWAALYFLLSTVLQHVSNWGGLVSVVAQQHIFVNFFLVLSFMLAFSNAILTFSTLYGRTEAGHLLALPVETLSAVLVKWVEGLILSSWSFLLLGVPLMLAVAANTTVEWYFYPLFLAHFVGFIAIPACVGLLAGCAVALYAPRRPLVVAVIAGIVLTVLFGFWVAKISRSAAESEEWLRVVLNQLNIARNSLIPSTWTAFGIVAAMEQRIDRSLYWLGVVIGNAAFISWVTINILASTWPLAYSRASHSFGSATIRRGWLTQALCSPMLLVLPRTVGQLLLKDVRYFARDAKQWMQMLIMFGLLLIYVLNLRSLPLDLNQPGSKSVMVFLNLTTVSLILATFTSRFIFPLVSLESQQLWLLELLPLRRSTLLLVKFWFALTLTLLSGGGVMTLAIYQLDLPPIWAAVNLVICANVCIGLSGLAIGLGARFPMLGQRNPARIAAGFGGTFNLISSMVYVLIQVAGAAALAVAVTRDTQLLVLPDRLTAEAWMILSGLTGLALVVAGGALAVGARHFGRLEV